MGPGTDLDKKVSPCVINRASDLKGIVWLIINADHIISDLRDKFWVIIAFLNVAKMAVSKKALQSIITSLQKSYDGILREQLVKLGDGDEKGTIKKKQPSAKDELGTLGGKHSGSFFNSWLSNF